MHNAVAASFACSGIRTAFEIMEKSKTAAIYTLGCKVNQYESEAIAERLRAQGVEILPDNASVAIINTCSVTGESDRKSRQVIRRAIRENPGSPVLVTGCLAQVEPAAVAAIPGVSFVCGNKNKTAVADKALEFLAAEAPGKESFAHSCPEVSVSSLEDAVFEKMTVSGSERTRAYIKIEDGCESRCAYCIIPRARGRIRSKQAEEILAEAAALCRKGYKELVLTGIEVSAYGSDLPDGDLGTLLCALDRLPGISRIRFSSIDPSFLKPAFTDRIASLPHLAPHFHLSLQSGCSETLGRMRRRYTAETVADYVAYLRKKLEGVQFTADVIVGFPGETEKEFRTTCDFLSSLGLLSAHVFAYSRRKGTVAAEMPGQIPESEKKRRSEHLISLLEAKRREVLEGYLKEHTEGDVLFEQREAGGGFFGRLPNFIGVEVMSGEDLHGQIRPVSLSSLSDTQKNPRLLGKILKSS